MEPENIEIVSMICRKVKKNFNGYKDIWLWTGYSFEQCLLKDSDILKYVDTLVDGPFIEELKDPTLKYRGSSNQRIIDVAKSLAKNKPIIIDERELQCLNSSSMTMSGRR